MQYFLVLWTLFYPLKVAPQPQPQLLDKISSCRHLKWGQIPSLLAVVNLLIFGSRNKVRLHPVSPTTRNRIDNSLPILSLHIPE